MNPIVFFAVMAGTVLGMGALWMYWLNPPAGWDRNLFEKNGPLEGGSEDD